MNDSRSTGSILAILGGIGLAIGAFLSWGTVTLDAAKFATALGIDPNLLTPGAVPTVTQSVSGTDGWEGKVAIVAGIVAIVAAVLSMREVRKGLGVLLIVAGLIGGGVALYDVVTVNDQKDAAIQDAAPDLQAVGIQTSQLSDAIDVSLDVGIWITMLAGVVVIVGGAMIRAREGTGSVDEPSIGSALGAAPPQAPIVPSPTVAAPPTPPGPIEPPAPAGGAEAPPADAGPDATS